jgi:phosphoenolpyruvate carboxykinase (ATP)
MSLSPDKFLELIRAQIDANLRQTTGMQGMSKEGTFDVGQFTTNCAFESEMNSHGLNVRNIVHNATPAVLYEHALRNEKGSFITKSGAVVVSSGAKTGRSPTDKRIVDNPSGEWAFSNEVWWGKVNIKLSEESFFINRERALAYLNTCSRLYVVDAYAGWDPKYRIKIRVVTCRAYHALFMQNMLIMPTAAELVDFKPDFVIYNAGKFPANKYTKGMTSSTSVCMHFKRNEMVILGTEYAGEMKKGILTLMMYLMPKRGQLPLHSSCNVGPTGDVTLFFGLSGTGKTTLSADPNRALIGDDEHVWTDEGVFNIEGGCYAKCVGLSEKNEPEIFKAIRFGTVLENVVYNPDSRLVNYDDTSITENTRAAYPLHYIPNARIPATIDTHPSAIILLCCDAFGVLPPVSMLTPEQVQYYFISGYTAKVAGTEQGVKEPTATFSACFGSPFLVWHPIVYAEMLAERLKKHAANAYLLNTGYYQGKYGVGKRIPLKYTRKMVDAINSGELVGKPTEALPVFNLAVPTHIEGVPDEILMPRNTWTDKAAYDDQLAKLADLFKKNFTEYADRCPHEVCAAGPFF